MKLAYLYCMKLIMYYTATKSNACFVKYRKVIIHVPRMTDVARRFVTSGDYDEHEVDDDIGNCKYKLEIHR